MNEIIGYHVNSKGIIRSDTNAQFQKPFLDYLLEKEAIKLFFDLDYSVAKLIRLIGISKEEAAELSRNNELRLGNYNIKYIPNKFFSIKKYNNYNSQFACISDAQQYLQETIEYDADNEWACALSYAQKAASIGEKVYGQLGYIGLRPTNLISPVKAYENEVLKFMNLPNDDDIEEKEAGLYAYNCCTGNWQEAFALGHFENVYQYDINKAYPYQLSELIDFRAGKCEKVSSEDALVDEDLVYGYYKCNINIKTPYGFSPIFYSNSKTGEHSINYAPDGKQTEIFLNKTKVECIRNSRLGNVEIIDGWEFSIPQNKRTFPLKNAIETITRHTIYNSEFAEIGKRIMSGIYGKLGETHNGELGDRFNPIWTAEVQNNNDVEVFRFCVENNIKPLYIVVDGVIAKEKVDCHEEENRVLGSWRRSGSPVNCLIFGTGAVAIEGKKSFGEFSLDYKSLLETMQANPETESIELNKKSFVGLASALNSRGDNWANLGKTTDYKRTVYIGGEGKRLYKEQPKTAKDMMEKQYYSEPWDASLLKTSNMLESR